MCELLHTFGCPRPLKLTLRGDLPYFGAAVVGSRWSTRSFRDVSLRRGFRFTSNTKGQAAMARSKRMRCAVSKLSKSGILGIGIAGLVLLLGSRPAGAGPPNPTPSDTHGNTAGGTFALLNNTTGVYNTAFGQGALYSNAAGNSNTAIGLNALINNAGDYNTAIGVLALPNNRATTIPAPGSGRSTVTPSASTIPRAASTRSIVTPQAPTIPRAVPSRS